MSVIGRLDEQVSKILIEPLAEKHRADERPTSGQSPREPTPPSHPPSQSTHDESEAERRELPVWLL
ncbi:MAG: hypothetical protein WCD76_21255 [Pyrinomonadaceae bacterium]